MKVASDDVRLPEGCSIKYQEWRVLPLKTIGTLMSSQIEKTTPPSSKFPLLEFDVNGGLLEEISLGNHQVPAVSFRSNLKNT